MSRAHIAGIIATVEAAGLIIHDTDVPTEFDANGDAIPVTFPYLLLTAPDFDRVALSLDDVPRDIESYFQLTCAGSSVAQCRWIQEKAWAALDRKSPTVAGYVTRTKRTIPGAVYPDRSVTLPSTGNPFFAPDQWRYTATPNA